MIHLLQENAKIDEDINELFKILCLYVTEPSCHLILEYLIRRYRIHEMNAVELICMIIPYHDSKVRNNDAY